MLRPQRVRTPGELPKPTRHLATWSPPVLRWRASPRAVQRTIVPFLSQSRTAGAAHRTELIRHYRLVSKLSLAAMAHSPSWRSARVRHPCLTAEEPGTPRRRLISATRLRQEAGVTCQRCPVQMVVILIAALTAVAACTGTTPSIAVGQG